MKSIQSKILVVVISGLLVITAAVSVIAVKMTHEIIHRDADRILNNVTQKEAAIINDALGDVSKSTAIMQHYARAEITDVSELEDPEFLHQYLRKTEKMFTEIALNTQGINGFYMRLNPAFTTPTTGYYNLVMSDSTIQKMQVTDLSKYPPDDEKNVGWYYSVLRAGQATWLDPYYFPGHNKQMISYAVPLYVNMELLGVIGFDMDFEYLVNRIDDISVYDDGYAVLVAKDGVSQYNNQNREDSPDAHTKARTELRNGMYLELRAEYKDIQKDIRPLMVNIVLAFACVLALAIVYTIFVTHKIVGPLKQLTAVANNISVGTQLDQIEEFPVDAKDEIGTLARVLRSTYGKISEYTAYINALAYRDSLTGIKNSTAYAEAIAELNKEINCTRPEFGVLVVDINNLKLTNDRYGHDVGNELIIHTAKSLMENFKHSPVFRIGGDEFAVVLRGKDYDNYHELQNRLDRVCAADFVPVMETKIPVSIARGYALFDPEIDKVYEDVFAKADHAMYLHKEKSKATLA